MARQRHRFAFAFVRTMPVTLGGAAKRAKREAVQRLGGYPRPRGGTPSGCTWDYAAGVWRNADGEQRAINQTRLDNAAHRHLPRKRSRLQAARYRAAPYPRAAPAAAQPAPLFSEHGELMQLVRPRAHVVSDTPVACAREGACAGTHLFSAAIELRFVACVCLIAMTDPSACTMCAGSTSADHGCNARSGSAYFGVHSTSRTKCGVV